MENQLKESNTKVQEEACRNIRHYSVLSIKVTIPSIVSNNSCMKNSLIKGDERKKTYFLVKLFFFK